MELKEAIEKRRSIRKFLSTPISVESKHELLEAVRYCPSAKNRQPWKIVELEGTQKERVAEIMLHLFEQNHHELPGYMNSSKGSALVIMQAPVLYLFLKPKDDVWEIEDLLSMGAAIEHLCLAATDQGLGSLWIRDTTYTEREILNSLNIVKMDLVSAVAIGYADEDPAMRPRKSMKECLLEISHD